MCQLTFSNLNHSDRNVLYLTLQMLKNTETSHKDGYGFYGETLFASEKTPNLVTNFSQMVRGHCNTSLPVFGHVRFATLLAGVKRVGKEFSHPFMNKRYVFAHNGSLSFKDKDRMFLKKYEGLIDSQIFLHRLTEVANGNMDLIDALPRTMEEFEGKFAFIIYDRNLNGYYLARGETAKLFISYATDASNKPVGYVVNTDKNDLEKTLNHFTQINYLMLDEDISLTAPAELPAEKIFQYSEKDDDLIVVGEVKENHPPVVVQVYDGSQKAKNFLPQATNGKNGNIMVDLDISKISAFASRFQELGLFEEEIDAMFELLTGDPLLGITEEDLLAMMEEILPNLFMDKLEEKRIIWDNIKINTPVIDTLEIYEIHKLAIPFMTNGTARLNKALRKIEREHSVK